MRPLPTKLRPFSGQRTDSHVDWRRYSTGSRRSNFDRYATKCTLSKITAAARNPYNAHHYTARSFQPRPYIISYTLQSSCSRAAIKAETSCICRKKIWRDQKNFFRVIKNVSGISENLVVLQLVQFLTNFEFAPQPLDLSLCLLQFSMFLTTGQSPTLFLFL